MKFLLLAGFLLSSSAMASVPSHQQCAGYIQDILDYQERRLSRFELGESKGFESAELFISQCDKLPLQGESYCEDIAFRIEDTVLAIDTVKSFKAIAIGSRDHNLLSKINHLVRSGSAHIDALEEIERRYCSDDASASEALDAYEINGIMSNRRSNQSGSGL